MDGDGRGRSYIIIGPQAVIPTPVEQGTRFASPEGEGDACTIDQPCSARTAIEGAVAGDVVFLRGGNYQIDRHLNMSKTGDAITVESYPDETAVFDNSAHPYDADIQLLITGDNYRFRRIEITGMTRYAGLWIDGNHNLVEGVYSHDQAVSGFQVTNKGSFNTFRSCVAKNNTGVGLSKVNGGNTDGFMISKGNANRIESCAAYSNSDDGIDVWQSTNSYIGYCISAHNGRGNGDGNGIKAGGSFPSNGTLVEHCLSYLNATGGIVANSGDCGIFIHNTTWANGDLDYRADASTTVSRCVGETSDTNGTQIDNSWNRGVMVEFASTDPDSSDFLVPTNCTDIGAGFRP